MTHKAFNGNVVKFFDCWAFYLFNSMPGCWAYSYCILFLVIYVFYVIYVHKAALRAFDFFVCWASFYRKLSIPLNL